MAELQLTSDNFVYYEQPKGRSGNLRCRDRTFHLFSRVFHRSSPFPSAFPPSLNDLHPKALNSVRSERVNWRDATTLEFNRVVTMVGIDRRLVRVDWLTCGAIV
jgi:hypothetical protein